MSSCRWCEESKVHKEDCPAKDDKLTGQVTNNRGEWVETDAKSTQA